MACQQPVSSLWKVCWLLSLTGLVVVSSLRCTFKIIPALASRSHLQYHHHTLQICTSMCLCSSSEDLYQHLAAIKFISSLWSRPNISSHPMLHTQQSPTMYKGTRCFWLCAEICRAMKQLVTLKDHDWSRMASHSQENLIERRGTHGSGVCSRTGPTEILFCGLHWASLLDWGKNIDKT